MRAPKDCPCHSGLRYAACCGPRHDGTKLAETAEALMRSRYAAFALGLGDYLDATLANAHPDKGSAKGRQAQRFMGLCILHASENEVLFYARIFEKGRDLSFAELSTFIREDGRIRYASGYLVPRDRLGPSPETLTLEAFLAL